MRTHRLRDTLGGKLHQRAAHVHVEVHDPEGDEGKEDHGDEQR